MQNVDFMLMFDVIILFMGVYIFYAGFKTKKNMVVDKVFVPDEVMMNCKDQAGFAKYMLPKIFIMGTSCVAYGIVEILNDTVYKLNRVFDAVCLVVVLVIWGWFSYCLRTGSKPYFR